MSAPEAKTSHVSSAANQAHPDLVLTRLFDAPRDLMFKVWTDPKHLVRWWGPHMFTNPVCELEPRAGGAIRIEMRGPDGTIYPMTGFFSEFVPPERLVFTCYIHPDAAGNPIAEVENSVTFSEQEGKTKLTLRARVLKATPAAADALAGMDAGWSQSLDRLAEELERSRSADAGTVPVTAERELAFTRMFDAPRDLVFEVWTTPRHLEHWWGPNGFTTKVHAMDVKPGGVWRLTMRGPGGRDYLNRIVFLEVKKPERLVYKHDPEEGTEPVRFEVRVTFVEREGKTQVTMRMIFPSPAVRDQIAQKYGAVQGANQTLGRLEQYLSTLTGRNPSKE